MNDEKKGKPRSIDSFNEASKAESASLTSHAQPQAAARVHMYELVARSLSLDIAQSDIESLESV